VNCVATGGGAQLRLTFKKNALEANLQPTWKVAKVFANETATSNVLLYYDASNEGIVRAAQIRPDAEDRAVPNCVD
jgi:hypothetical protein